MTDDAPQPAPHAVPFPGAGMECAVLLEACDPELYRRNPFRRIGLPVLAGARELSKRVDQLKLAVELETGGFDWSFAPETPLSFEQLREVAQGLKDPTVRLVQELFWFWPENYPEEPILDEPLEHLTHAATPAAIEYWQGSAMQGRTVALHNLAVYYHRQALEMETLAEPAEDELIQLWFKALRFWEKIVREEDLWVRLRGRVANLADARVTMELVEQMRATLPEALAKICAILALRHGQQGRSERAALHAALVTHIHGDTAGAKRALEAYAAPIARRIDARVVEARNRLSREATAGLVEAVSLLRNSDEDLRLIELLCGAGSEFLVEISHPVVDTAMFCLVSYQRETQDDRGCLPLLTHLLDLEATPELKKRLAETFDIVYRNVLATERKQEGGNTVEGAAHEPSDHNASYRLLSGVISTAMQALGLGEASRQRYAARVAGLLKSLAVAACDERDDLPLALRAFEAALALPIGSELRVELDNARAQLQMDFERRKQNELQVQTEGHLLVINRHGICFNGQWVTLANIAGLRHGLLADEGEGDELATSHLIAWRSIDGAEYELNRNNLLPPSMYVEEHYARILDSIYFFLVPALIERVGSAIRAGDAVFLGRTALQPEGALIQAAGGFWKRDEPVAYASLETSIEGGHLIVSSTQNPRLSETYDLARTWNAPVFGYVVEALARA